MKKYIKLLALCFCVAILYSVLLCGCESALEKNSQNLSSYNLDIVYDDQAKSLDCNETIDYINSYENTLNNICFHLYPNAFRQGATSSPVSLSSYDKAYPNGASYGYINITGVKINGVDSEVIISGEDENILLVNLIEPLYPQDKVKIEIVFGVQLPNCNHRFGYGENTVNIANFYPIACVRENGEFVTDLYNANGDPFYSEMANYSVAITYPSDYVLASTGSQNTLANDSGKTVATMLALSVRDFALVLSKKYQVAQKASGKTMISYYYYDDPDFEQNLQTACDALSTFESMIGDYPYSTLSVCKTNFIYGGMEYPNLVYISDSVSDTKEYKNVIIHEIAHQWWYNLVGNNACDSSWLDEGLTEYTTALFYEKNPEYGVELKTIISNSLSNYNLFFEVYQNVYGDVDTSMNRKLSEYNTEYEYVYITYVKGMLLFDSLREVVGDKKFFNALQDYFEENKYSISTPDILIASFSKSTNYDLEAFFDSWIDGNVVIENLI